jgi:CubicO group peptidase (beta-lactamase class C family)
MFLRNRNSESGKNPVEFCDFVFLWQDATKTLKHGISQNKSFQSMKNIFLSLLLFFLIQQGFSQSLYFPPLTGEDWETVAPATLGWNEANLDSVIAFAGSRSSKAFIILKDGRIATEKYYGTFTGDSLWYWASASKSMTAFLTGIAQEEGFLSIEDTVSRFLGTGWTVCPPEKERLIRIRHQLTMTTGLQDPDPESMCTIDTCLKYQADAGTRWAYYNPPYLLIQDVIAAASGMNYQQYTDTRLKTRTGMTGFWYQGHYYSRPREMARFGLLILNRGNWAGDILLHDTAYFNRMVNTSQDLNKSYGYLWWLNAKGSCMVPGSQVVFPFDLIPHAPKDLIAALGKNDQKIYVVPSMGLVVIRMGNPASSGPGFLTFDDELWSKLMKVFPGMNVPGKENAPAFSIHPNPARGEFYLQATGNLRGPVRIGIFSSNGIRVKSMVGDPGGNKIRVNIQGISPGLYFVKINTRDSVEVLKVVIEQ